MKKHNMPNFVLQFGMYKNAVGAEHPQSWGVTRRVDIFPGTVSAKNPLLRQVSLGTWYGGSAAGATDGGMEQYCKKTRNWAVHLFQESWLDYTPKAKSVSSSSSSGHSSSHSGSSSHHSSHSGSSSHHSGSSSHHSGSSVHHSSASASSGSAPVSGSGSSAASSVVSSGSK